MNINNITPIIIQKISTKNNNQIIKPHNIQKDSIIKSEPTWENPHMYQHIYNRITGNF